MGIKSANLCTNKLSQLTGTEVRMDGQMMITDWCTLNWIESCNFMLTLAQEYSPWTNVQRILRTTRRNFLADVLRNFKVMFCNLRKLFGICLRVPQTCVTNDTTHKTHNLRILRSLNETKPKRTYFFRLPATNCLIFPNCFWFTRKGEGKLILVYTKVLRRIGERFDLLMYDWKAAVSCYGSSIAS
jgi:hypothetical protein